MDLKIGNNLFVRYHEGNKNFGDQLNKLIWPNLLSGCDIGQKCRTTIYGIGTILNKDNVADGRKVIFGSGVGYGEIPTITDDWTIYCVRGPESAKALGISTDYAVTDPAILVTEFVDANRKKSGIAFFPHESSLRRIPWGLYCNWLGFRFVSPRWSVGRVNKLLSNSQLVLTEALHGAIVADSLRTPWIPFKMNSSILDFKWIDWCRSVGLKYDPIVLGNVNLQSSLKKLVWRVKAPLMAAKLRYKINSKMTNITDKRVHVNNYKKVKSLVEELIQDLTDSNV
jgi:succinoglycan biosynthesis protein ExoV